MKTALLVVPLLALCLTGCIGLAVPMLSSGQTHGKVITPAQAKFIVPGATTRAEVEAKLGGEFCASPRMPAVAYSWEQPAAGLMWFWVVIIPPAGLGDGDFTERSHWRAFFVAYDSENKISRTRFVSLAGGQSLSEQLENWASGKRNYGTHIIDPDTYVPFVVEDTLNHLQRTTCSR